MSILLASQCRAARAMLGLSQKDLAQLAEVGSRTLADFETGTRSPHHRTLKAIRHTLEAAGILFIDEEGSLGPGVRLNSNEHPALMSGMEQHAPALRQELSPGAFR